MNKLTIKRKMPTKMPKIKPNPTFRDSLTAPFPVRVLPALIFLSLIVLVIPFAALSASAYAQSQKQNATKQDTAKNLTIYFFYGDGCGHCAKAKPFLESLEEKYPEITIKSYETWHNKANAELFISMSAACGTKVVGVPTIFIGNKPIIGFDTPERKGREIEEEVARYIREGGMDLVDRADALKKNLSCPSKEEERMVNLPVIGKIDTSEISLPILTIIIGLLDGFNPCAMWVLLFLLTLLAYSKSRKKMIIIGGTFVLISGVIYYLFIAAWLNLFLLIGFIPYLRIIVGLFAVVLGLINIKEIFSKKGISLSIPDSLKPKLFEKMRRIIYGASLPLVLLSVAVLAFTVNSIELLCTAGFPAIYTKILILNNLPAFSYYAYLLLYIIMYMLDDTLVFVIAVLTLSSKKLTEKQGKWMKFIGGIMMLILGLVLMISPQLLMFK